jgi:hypothetical protein
MFTLLSVVWAVTMSRLVGVRTEAAAIVVWLLLLLGVCAHIALILLSPEQRWRMIAYAVLYLPIAAYVALLCIQEITGDYL